MGLIPLKLPPGMSGVGTKYQASGRWYDGSLVRFFAKAIHPLGGWVAMTNGGGAMTLSGVARAIVGWRGNAGAQTIGIGTNTKAYAYKAGVLYDITPAGFTTGGADTTYSYGGYGADPYGSAPYGIGDPNLGTFTNPAVWQLDTFGEYLLGVCAPNDGKAYYWDYNVSNDFVAIPGAPTNNRGIVVTPERFIFILGAGGSARSIQWPSQGFPSGSGDWVVSDVTTAGDWDLEGNGEIVCGRRLSAETLIWTTAEVHRAQYIGGTLIYAFSKIGSNCGTISPGSPALYGNNVAWMGLGNFYTYNGYVQELPCEVQDRVFSNFNYGQAWKVTSRTTSKFGEITWHYPSAGSTENDRYVTWNHIENHWTLGALDRTCGCDAGSLQYPVAVSSAGVVYEHERGLTKPGGGTPYLESGPIEPMPGSSVFVSQIVPDENTLGQVQAYLYHSQYPTSAETLVGPFTVGESTDVLISDRLFRLRLVEHVLDNWHIGVFQLDAVQDTGW